MILGVAIVAIESMVALTLLYGMIAGLRILIGTIVLTHPEHSPHARAARAEAQRRADEIAWLYTPRDR